MWRRLASRPKGIGADEEQELDENDALACSCDRRHAFRILYFCVLALISGLCIYDYSRGKNSLIHWFIEKCVELMEAHLTLGIFVFIIVYVISCIFCLPVAFLTLGLAMIQTHIFHSIIKGWLLSLIIVFISSYTSAIICFLIARHIFHKCISTIIEKIGSLQKLNAIMSHAEHGLKLNIFLRLTPIIPFSPFNYAMGTLDTNFKHYLIGTLFIFPFTMLYSYLGSVIGFAYDNMKMGEGIMKLNSTADHTSYDTSSETGQRINMYYELYKKNKSVMYVSIFILIISTINIIAVVIYSKRMVSRLVSEDRYEAVETQMEDNIELVNY